jgi:hypothetical protein
MNNKKNKTKYNKCDMVIVGDWCIACLLDRQCCRYYTMPYYSDAQEKNARQRVLIQTCHIADGWQATVCNPFKCDTC